MILKDVILLTGFTARAKAYAQVLDHAGYYPELTILYGNQNSDRPENENEKIAEALVDDKLFLPDLSIKLLSTLGKPGWKTRILKEVESVNSHDIVKYLNRLSPKMVVFCGYGGEIVGKEALSTAKFLHVHSGWLPTFRGSTTCYYSWLEENKLGASAIILDAQIDTGPIVMRKRYKVPPSNIDMDYIWDPAIRADLLVEVMRYYVQNGVLPKLKEQSHERGRTYYKIHPVLKHLALCGKDLSREDQTEVKNSALK